MDMALPLRGNFYPPSNEGGFTQNLGEAERSYMSITVANYPAWTAGSMPLIWLCCCPHTAG